MERSPGFKRPKKVFIASPLALEVKIKVEGLSLENMPFRKGAKCLIRRKKCPVLIG